MKKSNKFKHPEYQYLDLLKDILKNGIDKPVFNNPGVYIRSVFGRQIRFDLEKGFPLLTTKKVFLRGIIHELLWFLKGDSNIKYLVDQDVRIWNEWAYKKFKVQSEKLKVKKVLKQEEFITKIRSLPKNDPFVKKWGDLGNVYGVQWRKWKTSDNRVIDQLGWAITLLSDVFHFLHCTPYTFPKSPHFLTKGSFLGKDLIFVINSSCFNTFLTFNFSLWTLNFLYAHSFQMRTS